MTRPVPARPPAPRADALPPAWLAVGGAGSGYVAPAHPGREFPPGTDERAKLLFVDLEASSLLPGGFPIEIAWVDQDGQGESFLIKPQPDWTEWSHASQGVHGIALERLIDEGVPAPRVARRVADVLAARGAIACSDAPAYDGQWLATLLETLERPPTVRLRSVHEIYGLACRPLLGLLPRGDGWARERAEQRVRNMAQDIVARAEEVEAVRPRERHRALPDAESLWRNWRAVEEEVARRLAEEGAG